MLLAAVDGAKKRHGGGQRETGGLMCGELETLPFFTLERRKEPTYIANTRRLLNRPLHSLGDRRKTHEARL